MPVGITWSIKDAPLNERLGVVQPSLRAVFSVRKPKSALEGKHSGACRSRLSKNCPSRRWRSYGQRLSV